jgi:Xaa-Pro aminopeptidase
LTAIDERQIRVAKAAHAIGGAWAIVTGPDAVSYASGHEVPYETGPSPFAGGPTTAFVAADGGCHLLLANNEPYTGRLETDRVVVYEGFSAERPLQGNAEYVAAARRLARELGVSGTVAVEAASFPASLAEALADRIDATVPIDAALARARMVKTGEEVVALRRACAAADAGQRAALRSASAGQTELELFAVIRCAMETEAGGRCCVAGECSSGPERTAALFDWPRTRRLEAGDPVIVDLAPRVGGYWADSARTLVVGDEPGRALARLIAGTRSGLERACEVLRPGLTASAFDAVVRRAVLDGGGTEYAHHSGHSIGVSVHEDPRLVPGDETTLEAGMVIMVEPSSYEPGVGGARSEWMFLVTEHGNEVISAFESDQVSP